MSGAADDPEIIAAYAGVKRRDPDRAEKLHQRIIEETKECFRSDDVEELIRIKFETVLKAFHELDNKDLYRDLLVPCALDNIRIRNKMSTEKDLENSQLSGAVKAYVRKAISDSLSK